MKRIVLIGAGNVATHLYNAIAKTADFKVVQVYNHKRESLISFSEKVKITTVLAKIAPADIYIVAIKDDVLPEIASKLNPGNSLIVHTSGGTEMDVFKKRKNYGVFYPLQTFTKNQPIEFLGVPICIEANTPKNEKILRGLAESISKEVYPISSKQRKSLHLAAVFVSNFVNLMYTEAETICKKHEIPFQILHPLIMETAAKIGKINPVEAQTGPAKRNDTKVINSHLQQLDANQQEIYKLLTSTIQKIHGKEL